MRTLIATLVLLVVAIGASATCTPITVGASQPQPPYPDNGQGPNFYLGYGGNSFVPGTIQVSVIPGVHIGGGDEYGYVEVKAGFGGCTYSWDTAIIHWQVFTDITTNEIIFQDQAAQAETLACGNVPYCYFWDYQHRGPWHVETLISGHTYRLTEYMYASVYNVPGIVYSPTYAGTLTIEVQ